MSPLVRRLLFALVFVYGLLTEPVQGQDRDPVVWEVVFDGNETYDRVVLNNVIATDTPSLWEKLTGKTGDYLVNEDELRRDRIRLERYYQRRGFDQVTVNTEREPGDKEWKERIRFRISEGAPLRVGSFEWSIDGSVESARRIRESALFRRAEQQHNFQPGVRYQSIRESEVTGLFLSAMEEDGYAYSVADLEVSEPDSQGEVEIRLTLKPGPRMRYGGFSIEGEYTVRESVILRETGLSPGDLYREDEIQEAQRELFNHHLFRFATLSIPEEASPDSLLDATIRVRQQEPRAIRISAGFGQEEKLRGEIGWEHRNVGGWAHRFGISARASFIEQRGGVDYLIPYLFNTKSSLVSAPYIQRRLEPAFELFRIGYTNSMIYQHSRSLTGTISYELNFNEELSRNQDISLPDSILSYNTGAFSVTGLYNTVRSRQGEGWHIQPGLEISSLFSEGSYAYRKATMEVRNFRELNPTLMLATRIQGGVIHTPETDSLPTNIRFFTGGTNTVRGWSRQQLGPQRVLLDGDGSFEQFVPSGGRAFSGMNVELRQSLDAIIRRFGMAAFLDGGQVWRSARRLGDRPLQFGAGGGIRYESPIGPVRVDIAYQLNPSDADRGIYQGDPVQKRSRWGIHFSIGQAF
ncbi:MAG: BamA/TamA family outer membrane protein [Balneolaceae bacterium]